MHVLGGLSSLLIVVLAGILALGLLRLAGGWPGRRAVQLLILGAPLVSLALGLGGLYHFNSQPCFLAAQSWDYAFGLGLPLAMMLVALGGLGVGLFRLTLMARIVTRRGMPAGPELTALATRVAVRLGAAEPRLLLCPYDQPLALTCGLWQPTVLISTWMVERLDRHELEAVLAHEVGHVVRRDYSLIWLATLLRDAFWYLPTTWAAYYQLQHEKELACDDLAIDATDRPLALASALAKVWQYAAEGPRAVVAQPLLEASAAIEIRIARLLTIPESPAGRPRALLMTGTAALIGLIALEAVTVALLLAAMGCGPASSLVGMLG